MELQDWRGCNKLEIYIYIYIYICIKVQRFVVNKKKRVILKVCNSILSIAFSVGSELEVSPFHFPYCVTKWPKLKDLCHTALQ